MRIEVDAVIARDGKANVKRIHLDGQWQTVEQGRQWQDEEGRHVLIMFDGRVQELLLRSRTLCWELHSRGNNRAVA